MKLTDAGTKIGEVKSDAFAGAAVHALRVTYEEAVGGDTWYFYFDSESS